MFMRALYATLIVVIGVSGFLMPNHTAANETPDAFSMHCTYWVGLDEGRQGTVRHALLCQIAEEGNPIPRTEIYMRITSLHRVLPRTTISYTHQSHVRPTEPCSRGRTAKPDNINPTNSPPQ
jgi:hypothetical protein